MKKIKIDKTSRTGRRTILKLIKQVIVIHRKYFHPFFILEEEAMLGKKQGETNDIRNSTNYQY